MPLSPGLRDILVFEVGGQRYGLPGTAVHELLRAVLISPLPRSSPFVEGVINLRGLIVPVLDIRHWLGLPAKPLEHTDHFIVLRVDERQAAIRVDRALELVKLESPLLEPGPSLPGGEARTQVVKLPEGLLVLPDLSGLLAQEFPRRAAALAPAAPAREASA